MKNSEYATKLDTMIDDAIMKDTNIDAADNTLRVPSHVRFHPGMNFFNLTPG